MTDNHKKILEEYKKWFGYGRPGHKHLPLAEGAFIELGDWILEKLQEERESVREAVIKDMKEYNDILYKNEAFFFVNTFLDIYREKLKSEEEK